MPFLLVSFIIIKSVPYEKGFALLFYLESILGGADVFNPYLRAHFKNFSGKSISTDDFKSFLYSYMKKAHGDEKIAKLNSVDWDAWFKGQGFPPVISEFDQTLAIACKSLATRWTESAGGGVFSPSDIEDFSPTQKMAFLDILLQEDSLPADVLLKLDATYGFGSQANMEIKYRWQFLCLKAAYEPIYPDVVSFITRYLGLGLIDL